MEPTGQSESLTNGIRIAVKSFYIPEQSQPTEDHYFFAYRVQIRNEGTEAAQLISRHWLITDGDGEKHEVRGPGVIGEQPVLHPGEQSRYSSFCPQKPPWVTWRVPTKWSQRVRRPLMLPSGSSRWPCQLVSNSLKTSKK